MTPTPSMDWFVMGMGLFGGLALFLFGMEQLSDALKAVAGEKMKTLLVKLTGNRLMAATTGAFVTAIIQSSSVTTVLVVGFVSAGLMTMTQSIGIIMGANVGTTVTAHIVAFKVTEYALLLVAAGYAAFFLAHSDKLRQYGLLAMGLGLIFFGMGIMSESMAPLRSYQPFIDLMVSMERPLFGILVAAAFTALVQSSSATTGIVIVMASQGFITLPAGIAMALGANVGTCFTAMLAALGKPVEAVRAAVVHVLFNLAGVLIWVGFIDQLAALAIMISPLDEGLAATERLAAETPRQIANANTVFNLINTVLFLFFTGTFARIVTRLIPDRPEPIDTIVQPKFLDRQLLDMPALALNAVRLEIGRMGACLTDMLDSLARDPPAKSQGCLDDIRRGEDKLDALHNHITEYLSHIQLHSLSEAEAGLYQQLLNTVAYLEMAGDVINDELLPILHRSANEHPSGDHQQWNGFPALIAAVTHAVALAVAAVVETNAAKAGEAIAAELHVDAAITAINRQYMDRQLSRAEIQIYRLTLDVTEKFRRVYSLSKRISRSYLPGKIDR